jgi:anti-sigma B factor antagonist
MAQSGRKGTIMEINVKQVEGITVVELDGRIDGRTAPQVEAEIAPLIEPECRIVLDMTRVDYLSSAGLRTLIMAQREVSGGGGQLALAGLVARVRDTMSITGFLPFFTTHASVEMALATLR